MGVFKSYDVRGTYPDEINEEIAYKIGRAAVLFLKCKKIGVGRDCRLSSPALAKSLIYGITDQGADVVDFGLTSTPCMNFASKKFPVIMVTASHNPADYNGFKIVGKNLAKIGFANGLDKIQSMIEDDFPAAKRKGTVLPGRILPEYVKKVRSVVRRLRPLRVLFDTGNGMGGLIIPEVLKGLPIKYKILFKEPDGSFPNHLADPVKAQNTADLQREVVKGRYNLGIAYDADCDRVKFIDEKGNRIRSEYALVLIAKYLRVDKVVKTVSCSRIIDDLFKHVFVSTVGHVNVAEMMKKHDCDIGAEISGHFFFKKFWFADSGDVAMLCMLGVLSENRKPLSALVAPLETYFNAEEINIKVKDADKALKNIEKHFSSAKISELDGLSVDAGEFWFNIRKSNTEPLVRLNAEAKTKKDLDDCIKKVKSLV